MISPSPREERPPFGPGAGLSAVGERLGERALPPAEEVHGVGGDASSSASAVNCAGGASVTIIRRGENERQARHAGSGGIPDLPDIRDYTAETQEVREVSRLDRAALPAAGRRRGDGGELPAAVDLRKWASPVEDQGTLGSCTAQAGAGSSSITSGGRSAATSSRRGSSFTRRPGTS